MRCRVLPIATFIGLALLIVPLTYRAFPQSVQVRVQRKLILQQVAGQVAYQRGKTTRPARTGDALQAVGDGISTGQNATATLAVDTAIGFITVAENTKVSVRELRYASDDGRITRLQVSQGQVRLRLRRFTHRGSVLEIQTPAGISGVRGTEFGLNVQPQGKTSVATLTGGVAAIAQGKTVTVKAGFQNYTIPGEAPSTPVPIRNSTELKYGVERFTEGRTRKIRLTGQVDPVNSVLVENIPQITDRQGRFSLVQLMPNRLKVQITVITPLGKKQIHELEIR
jgi:hypothetical protein